MAVWRGSTQCFVLEFKLRRKTENLLENSDSWVSTQQILEHNYAHIPNFKCHLPPTCKGKGLPLRVWTGPDVSRSLRLPEFFAIQHKKVVRLSALRNGRLYP